MSEGIKILNLISLRGGCHLFELALELGIPKNSVKSWISMLCSTGYLKKEGEDEQGCSCRKSVIKCMCCHSSCKEQKKTNECRIVLTERGYSLIRRRWDKKPDQKFLNGKNLHPQ